MKKSSMFIVGIIVFWAISVNASTFKIIIDDNVPLAEIQSFQFIFDVSEDFSFDLFSYGSAIPTNGTFGWDKFLNHNQNKNQFKIMGGDRDGQWDLNYHDLRTGVLATFNYSGDIYSIDESALQFSNRTSSNTWPSLRDIEKVSYNLTETSITFSAVPIPSTLLLLGGGIAAIAGGTRRKTGGK